MVPKPITVKATCMQRYGSESQLILCCHSFLSFLSLSLQDIVTLLKDVVKQIKGAEHSALILTNQIHIFKGKYMAI